MSTSLGGQQLQRWPLLSRHSGTRTAIPNRSVNPRSKARRIPLGAILRDVYRGIHTILSGQNKVIFKETHFGGE